MLNQIRSPSGIHPRVTLSETRYKMPKFMNMALLAPATILSLVLSSGAFAQSANARQSMERCVERVLSQMARTKAPEAQVGQAVVSQCDAPLRAVLQSAIQTGEAAVCSVESCIGMARQRAAEEATSAYRGKLAGKRSG